MNRRRGLRRVVIAALVVVAVAGAGLAALPQVVRGIAIWQLRTATGRPVTLDAVELALFRGRAAVRGLRVMDRDGQPLATLARVEARFRPGSLLRGRIHLADGVLDALTIRVVRTGPTEFNVSDLLARPTKARGGPTITTTIDRFTVRNVAVVIEDRTPSPARTWRVEAEGDLHDASTRPEHRAGTISVRGTVSGAPFSLTISDLRLAPLKWRGVFAARGVDAGLASLAVPAGSVTIRPGGTVDAAASLAHDAATGTLIGLDVGFHRIELERFHTAFLTAPTVRVAVEGLRVRAGAFEVARVGVDGGTLTLADAQLGTARRWKVDGVTFEARHLSSARDAAPGTAQASATMAGAQMALWGANVRLAPLELHATTIVRNVDLGVMRAYLPPALPVQPERGVVNATIQIDHDARGTRLALDARLAGIEVQRPGHVVTAPAFRVAAEEIALSRDAVTIRHISAGGEQLSLVERFARPERRWEVQKLVFEAKDLSSRSTDTQGVATLQATVAGASVSAWLTQVRLQPLQLHLTTSVRNLDVALLRLYLPPEALVEFTRGVVNAAVDVHHTAAEGTRVTGDATLTGMEARGRWRFSTLGASAPTLRVTLADVRRHEEKLSVGRIELTGSGALVDGRSALSRLDFSQLRISTENLTWPVSAPARVEVSARFGDRGELDANGTARLTAPLPKIAWSADLALAFRGVDLTPLGVYVPAAAGFGGRVRANLTAAISYAGRLTGRIRGDVAGGRFVLVEGDRTLLSLRRIDVTGLDAQWPERMAIAQVRLSEPYALIERDGSGRFPLLERFAPPTPAEAAPAPATGEAKARLVPMAIGEVVVENGRALVLDASGGTPPARVELPRLNLTARDVTWPRSSTPARVLLDATLPAGGTAKVEGTVIGEPASIDLTVSLANVDVGPLQPYLPFRAQVRARVDGNLAATGPLSPTPRVSVRGDAAIRTLAFADGADPLITVERIDVSKIDATWPERVALERVRVTRSWALIDRDRQGRFLLRALLERAPPVPGAPAPAPPIAPRGTIPLTVRELVLEQQSATIVDATTTPAARFEVTDARLKIDDLTWPSRAPMKIDLASPMPGGGRVTVAGALELAPVRLDARAVLDAVALAPVQPYLPIEGKVTGQVTGEVAVKVALDPLSVRINGQTRLQRFRLHDGDRPVLTVGRADVAGIDVDWPRRLAAESVQFRRPRLLVERDALGEIRLWRVAIPNWTKLPSAGTPPPATSSAPTARAVAPVIEIGSLRLELASARFVDQSTTPTYAEELSDLEMTMAPLTTGSGRRSRFTVAGGVGGGTFKARGEAVAGDPTHVALTVEVRDYIVPRANPYLDLYTGWTATHGSLDLTGVYTVTGTRLETRHDVVVRGLDVAPVDTRDEVERRVGLPFGLLVSLLKDSRGAIKLSLPVAGDVSTRQFEFQDALWGAVRALALRLVALPFSRIGSLFVSEDSKVEAVAITPVTFEPGTQALGPGMEAHLQKVAAFLREAPAVALTLSPIFTQADAAAVKGDGDASEALRALGEQRVGVVRDALVRAGIDGARLRGQVPRRPFVEAAGASRVELNPHGREALDDAPPRG